MYIKGKYKKGFGGRKVEGKVTDIQTVVDSGGTFFIITTTTGERIETYQLEYCNLSNMPHHVEARRKIAKILDEL